MKTELVTMTAEDLQNMLQVVVRKELTQARAETLRPLYSYKAAAELLGKPRQTLDRWVRAGILRKVKIYDSAYIDGGSIAQYLNTK